MFFIVSFIVIGAILLLPAVLLSYFFQKRFFIQTLVSIGLFFGAIALLPVFTNNGLDSAYTIARGFLFIYIIISIMLFCFGVGLWILHKISPLTKKHAGIGMLLLTGIYFGLAVVGGQQIQTQYITLPADFITREYTFAHISDLHSGSTSAKHAEKVVTQLATLDPEFVVITGDFIDTHTAKASDTSAFQNLSMPVYLISGNHDYDISVDTMREIANQNNITVIDDTKITYDEIDIIGIDERSSIATGIATASEPALDTYTILLKHEPLNTHVEYTANNTGVNLMLAGHTHNGQIWPFNLLVGLRYDYLAGLYPVEDMLLYVNQGTGTLGPNLRFGTQNEITMITLVPTTNN